MSSRESRQKNSTSSERASSTLPHGKYNAHPKFDPELIAPCGMNCAICKAHLRKRNPCLGCNVAAKDRPKTRLECPLRTCGKRSDKFCCACPEFPCAQLRHLDQRYRTKYGMSQIENLELIRAEGIEEFVAKEGKRWFSNAGVLCVHDGKCYRQG